MPTIHFHPTRVSRDKVEVLVGLADFPSPVDSRLLVPGQSIAIETPLLVKKGDKTGPWLFYMFAEIRRPQPQVEKKRAKA